MYLQPTPKLKFREVEVLMLFRDTETLPMDEVFRQFDNHSDTFHAIDNHIREGVLGHDEIEKRLSLTEVGKSELKKLTTPKRKSKPKPLKMNPKLFDEVYALARHRKAWMLRHFRRATPRTDLERRLIARERDIPLWKYAQSHTEVSQVVKRLSVKQHALILAKIKEIEASS